MAYDAFISYSHAADGKLAPALHNGLKSFAKPYYRRRAVRVFRDETNLGIHPDLWGEIVEALEQARFFLLLASPQGAQSPWVGKEVAFWRQHRDVSRLLLVVTEGEIAWDDEAGDFDWEETTALPPGLAGAFDSEPLYLDLRWARSSEDLSLANPRFRDAVARLSAELRGIPLDDLVGEDVRQHRRTRRHVRAAIGTLSALVLATSAAAWYAFDQRSVAEVRRQEAVASAEQARDAAAAELAQRRIAERQTTIAVEQREIAEAQTRLAVAQRIAAQGQLLVATGSPEEVETGSLLVMESLRRDPSTLQGHLAWSSVLERYPPLIARRQFPTAVRTNAGTAVTLSPDGRHLAVSTREAGVLVLDVRSGETVYSVDDVEGSVVGLSFRADSNVVALAQGRSVRLHDFERAEELARSDLPSSALALAFSPDGRRLAVGDQAGNLHLFATTSPARLRPESALEKVFGDVMQPAIHPLGRLVIASTWHRQIEENVIRFWDLESRKTTGSYLQGDPSALALSPSGKVAALAGKDSVDTPHFVDLYSIESPEDSSRPIERGRLRRLEPGVRSFAVAIDASDETVAVGVGALVQLWNAQTGARYPDLAHSDVKFAAWVDEGRSLGTASTEELKLWNTSIGARLGDDVRRQGTPLATVESNFERHRGEVCRRVGRDLSTAERERYLGAEEAGAAAACSTF